MSQTKSDASQETTPETRDTDRTPEDTSPPRTSESDDSGAATAPKDDTLDLDIEEQGDGDRLKEGFTGQER